MAIRARRWRATFAAAGCNVLAFGEMGIGNTASASLLTHCITGLPLADCVGRGTGLDDAGLERKRALLAQACLAGRNGRSAPRRAASPTNDALRILARFGGFEIAMLAGAMLAAAEARMTLLIDGFIVTAALLVAARCRRRCSTTACSRTAPTRPATAGSSTGSGGKPLLDLGLRLGEGTGAALALPLLKAACAFMNEMASFESAGVSGKS
jgi:nicotinate-nucleotide--dimethylbenzimidazole phosphoribosyltransferase